jgi:hypothetical protein
VAVISNHRDLKEEAVAPGEQAPQANVVALVACAWTRSVIVDGRRTVVL